MKTVGQVARRVLQNAREGKRPGSALLPGKAREASQMDNVAQQCAIPEYGGERRACAGQRGSRPTKLPSYAANMQTAQRN